MRTLATSLLLLISVSASATEMTVVWEHDGSGALSSTGATLAPLDRFNVYQSATENGAYHLTHTLDDALRQQVIEMAYEPTTWVKMTAIAQNGTESYPSVPVSKTLPPPPPATVTMSSTQVFIACDPARFTRAKTTGTGTKRTITCLK